MNTKQDSQLPLSFKQETSREKRELLAQKILSTYPDRVPVIVERAPKAALPALSKRKYLAPCDITVARFTVEIKKQLGNIGPQTGIFLFVQPKSTLPQQSQLMEQLYREHKDEDGFLYLTLSTDNSFGGETKEF